MEVILWNDKLLVDTKKTLVFINSFLLCYTIGIEPLGVRQGG